MKYVWLLAAILVGCAGIHSDARPQAVTTSDGSVAKLDLTKPASMCAPIYEFDRPNGDKDVCKDEQWTHVPQAQASAIGIETPKQVPSGQKKLKRKFQAIYARSVGSENFKNAQWSRYSRYSGLDMTYTDTRTDKSTELIMPEPIPEEKECLDPCQFRFVNYQFGEKRGIIDRDGKIILEGGLTQEEFMKAIGRGIIQSFKQSNRFEAEQKAVRKVASPKKPISKGKP